MPARSDDVIAKTRSRGAGIYPAEADSVKQVGKNKFNVMIENAEGKMVTFMRDKSQVELRNLATNYGWNAPTF